MMLLLTFSAVFGLIIGSFLTVCIYRIPLGREDLFLDDGQAQDESEIASDADIAKEVEPSPYRPGLTLNNPPRSFCPSCDHQLSWKDNIPLFSWLILNGKCAYCKAPISIRYPTVELLTAIAAVLSYTIFGLTATSALIFIFTCSLIVISFIDYDYYIIPNVISLPGTVIGLAVGVLNQFTGIFTFPVALDIQDSVLGLLVGGGFLLIVSEGYLLLRKREGLGMGDVKLLAMTGAFFGYPASLFTIFVGSVLGSVLGILLILCAGRKMTHQLPFGPYLAFGTVLYLYGGPDVVAHAFDYISLLFK
jgi:leader peptidase (prepilin peptidase)/N-methyltransferase